MNEITLNGTVYVPKDEIYAERAKQFDGKDYVIVRTCSAGVHAGYLDSHNNREVVLINSRRFWAWSGAFTLSELARFGTKKPEECKFSATIDKILLTEAIEILYCTKQAQDSIESVGDYNVD